VLTAACTHHSRCCCCAACKAFIRASAAAAARSLLAAISSAVGGAAAAAVPAAPVVRGRAPDELPPRPLPRPAADEAAAWRLLAPLQAQVVIMLGSTVCIPATAALLATAASTAMTCTCAGTGDPFRPGVTYAGPAALAYSFPSRSSPAADGRCFCCCPRYLIFQRSHLCCRCFRLAGLCSCLALLLLGALPRLLLLLQGQCNSISVSWSSVQS
jgi:hypothetical protein